MKSIVTVLLMLLLMTAALLADSGRETDEDEIRTVIEMAYVNGVHIEKDQEAIRRGFHPNFSMKVNRNDQVSVVALNSWILDIERSKDFANGGKPVKITHKFPLIDITGNTAMVKIEIYKNSKLTYTDYLSLYKFSDGWKIVSKVFQGH